MLNDLRRILLLITTINKSPLIPLLLLMTLVAVVETLGIASIMPLISIISIGDTNLPFGLKELENTFRTQGQQHAITILLCCIFFVILVFTMFTKSIATYYQYRFIFNTEKNLSKQLFANKLFLSFLELRMFSSNEIEKQILSETAYVTQQAVLPFINLISRTIASVVLLSLLVYLDPLFAGIAFISLCFAYFIIYFLLKTNIKKYGDARYRANDKRFKTVGEAVSVVHLVKLYKKEKNYISDFDESSGIMAVAQAMAMTLGQVPRYIIELIAFGMALVILIFETLNGTLQTSLPIIGVYTLAAYRLLPAVQQIYGTISQVRYSSTAVQNIIEELTHQTTPKGISKNKNCNRSTFNFNQKDFLKVTNLSFTYPGAFKKTLSDINLTAKRGQIIGIVGKSGSGKSTLLNIIMGLIPPSSGSITLNTIFSPKNEFEQFDTNKIGYAAQNGGATGGDIYSNIAFSEINSTLNIESIENSAKAAEIHSFISFELKDNYKTELDGQGANLSGGQLQRIGMARAIYSSPQILVLDEATNALDPITERKILNNLKKLNLTLILATHNKDNLKYCDNILFLSQGTIKGDASFEELYKDNKEFRKIIDNSS